MHLTLEEAAERAKMLPEELLLSIENKELIAERSSKDAQFLISLEDLEAFLDKKSFESFWHSIDEAENADGELRPLAQSGNLRRVLTAETVAELKMEHKVLMSRMETLERLFSEFMEIEKTTNALVLEDSWKLEPTVSKQKIITDSADQDQSVEPKEQITTKKDSDLSTGSSQDVVSETSVGAQELSEEDPKNAEHQISKTPVGQEEPVPEPVPSKPASAKDQLANKLRDASRELRDSNEDSHQEVTIDVTQPDAEIENSIALKLAEYERRLAQAKQTATQIWH